MIRAHLTVVRMPDGELYVAAQQGETHAGRLTRIMDAAELLAAQLALAWEGVDPLEAPDVAAMGAAAEELVERIKGFRRAAITACPPVAVNGRGGTA